MKIDIHSIEKYLQNFIKDIRKNSMSSKFLQKRSVSTLEKLVLYFVIAIIVLIITVFFIVLPGLDRIKALKESINNSVFAIYGEEESAGLKSKNDVIQQKLEEAKIAFDIRNEKEKDLLNKAILPKLDTYYIATFLEDYSITMGTAEKPITVTQLSFGKVKNINVPVKDLKQSINQLITIPAEYQVLPVTVSLDAHREKFEQFLDFVYRSGDLKNFYFKGAPVPIMSIESLTLPVGNMKDETKLIESYTVKLFFYFQKEETLKTLNK